MFDKEIKFISDFSLNKVKKFGSFFTFAKLLSSDVHPAIIQYISAELDFLIFEDRKKLLQQSAFDYSGAEIANHLNIIGEEIKRDKKISFEDIKKLMLQAVSFNINFLIRPRWSLVKLVFNESEQKTFEEIKLAFNYIYYYDYIKNIFLGYLTKRNLTVLSITEFEAILTKIDKELFSGQAEKFLDNAIYSTAEFFNEGGVNKTTIFPAYFELFLKEKNLIDYQFKIRKYFPADSNQNSNVEEVRKVLYSSMPPQSIKTSEEVTITEPQTTPPETTTIQNVSFEKDKEDETFTTFNLEEQKTRENKKNSKINLMDKEQSPKNKPKDENIEHELIDDDLLSLYDSELQSIEDELKDIKTDLNNFEFTIEPEDSSDEPLTMDADIEEKENNISPLQDVDDVFVSDKGSAIINDSEDEIQFGSEEKFGFQVEDENRDNEIQLSSNKKNIKRYDKDVYEYLSKKDIRKIISSVFNEDREDFENTISKISESISYDEATEILKTVFLTYRVNPYSQEAVTLTNAVSNYFDQA
ncbi:MAG: hypothetical protein ACYDA4_05795 [Ignavibacteriaceae bacterium]